MKRIVKYSIWSGVVILVLAFVLSRFDRDPTLGSAVGAGRDVASAGRDAVVTGSGVAIHAGREAITAVLPNGSSAQSEESTSVQHRWTDVEQQIASAEYLVAMTQSLDQLIRARHGYEQIWSRIGQWPEYRLNRDNSPALYYASPEAQWCVLLESGRLYPLTGRLSDSQAPCYWDENRPLRADLASCVRVDGFADTLVPVAQRSADGLRYNQAWAYRSDLVVNEGHQRPAAWTRAMLRTNTDPVTGRQIIDRWIVNLQSGQTTQPLTYFPPYLQSWEQTENYRRGWRVRGSDGSILLAMINGQSFTLRSGEDIDTGEAERSNGGLDIRITLSTGSSVTEAAVEFIYYCEPRPATREGS